MDRFNGMDIPESLEDALDPATLALLVYDMQVGILAQFSDDDRVLANVLQVLAAARERGVRTVFVRHCLMPSALAGDAMIADTAAVCAALGAARARG